MLKPFIFGLGLISTLSAIPPVDTPSQNVLFETFSGAALAPDSLENYEGKIIIITWRYFSSNSYRGYYLGRIFA